MSLYEMKLAVRSCDCSKAPGPYGYTFIFHKRAWSFFIGDFFHLASRFSRKRILPRRINDAYISLISKEKDAVTFSEFRQISLVNSEGLSVLIERAEDGGFFTGISSGHGRTVTHLQYANDIVIFSKDDQDSLLNIKRILRC